MTEKNYEKLIQIEKAIRDFDHKTLYDSSIALYKALDYQSSRTDRISPNNFGGLLESFSLDENAINKERALAHQWKEVEFIFQLGAAEMQQQETLFHETLNRNEPASYLFFSVELTGNDYSRNQLSQIAREINKPFPMNVFVLFKYGKRLTLSLIDKRQNKKILNKDVVEKITHLFNINILKPHAAHVRILNSFSFGAIVAEAPKKRVTSFAELHNGWRKVISTDILNKQFYLDYSSLSVKLIQAIYPNQVTNKLIAHQGVLNLLNRIMFLYFVQKKEWIMEDENFVTHYWRDYQATNQQNHFHEHWLNTIFFNAFNGKAWEAHKSFKYLPAPIQEGITTFPYLNGGLFARNADYDGFILDDQSFGDIFRFFESYIFTITEDTAYDVNLEINPDLLGKMYEGMINATDLNDVDAENGIIYTERPEINFMARRSFVEVLDKKLNGLLSRDFLYHFVFDEPAQKRELLSHYKINIKLLRETIRSITICDPSCGSGSMLLGVIQLQMELLRVLDDFDGQPHTPKDDFNIKKQLVSECIYGVDIKEWAVRIAELRLWLYMIAEAEFSKEELSKTPLLPNLDFKLRQGNSLLQKIGSIDFSVEELLKGRNKRAGATRKLNEFIKKKKAFILNQEESGTTYQKLKTEEFEVFMRFISELITECELKLSNLGKGVSQPKLFPEPEQMEINLYAEDKARLAAEMEQLRKLEANIQKEKKLPFSYDIDFMEVFLTTDDPGFDLIIGNPPYVRQEQILPPEDGEYLESLLLPGNKDEKAKVNKEYKEELNAKVYKTLPFLSATVKTQIDGKTKVVPVYGSKVPGRSDLYCYFQLLCPAYLNSKGTFCFIISNSWMDTEFGSFIQQYLLKHTYLYVIYDSNQRSFDAAINTIIYCHSSLTNIPKNDEKYFKTLQPIENKVQFVTNKIDYVSAAFAPLLLEQEHCRKNTFNELYRVISLTQKELFQGGYDDEKSQYIGDKWGGKYLTAPEIFYKINSLGVQKNLMGKFSDHFVGERYLNTGGADGFFIITKFYYLENGNFMIENKSGINYPNDVFIGEIEAEFLQPLIKDFTRSSRKILIEGYDALCLVVKSDPSSNLIEYLKWGEFQGYDKRSVTKSQNPWYKPTNQMLSGSPILVPRSFNEVFSIFYNPKEYLSLRFYRLHPKNDNLLSKVCFFNSTLVIFFQEVLGNKSLGQGALDFFMSHFLAMAIPIVEIKESKSIFGKLSGREIQNIFTELGFNRTEPIREQLPNPLPDRKELDDLIFDELGLTQAERDEVYWSLAELVKQRLDKAASR